MISVENAKKEFYKYVDNYDKNNAKVELKLAHSIKVMQLSKKIAQSINLSQQQVELAELIGLLHDIGRFEQIRLYNTFDDRKSVNHGELGVKILFEENMIRKFIQDTQFDEIIKVAILNHNRDKEDIKISNQIEEMYSKIVRDADQLDIFEVILTTDLENVYNGCQDFSNETISDDIYQDFMQNHRVRYANRKTKGDIIVGQLNFAFSLNYSISFQILEQECYIDKLLKRINFKREETIEKINAMKQEVDKHIKEQLTKMR